MRLGLIDGLCTACSTPQPPSFPKHSSATQNRPLWLNPTQPANNPITKKPTGRPRHPRPPGLHLAPPAAIAATLTPHYCALLRQLAAAGATEVQLHEPVLCTDKGAAAGAVFAAAYAELAKAGVDINLVACYDDLVGYVGRLN